LKKALVFAAVLLFVLGLAGCQKKTEVPATEQTIEQVPTDTTAVDTTK